MNAETSTPVPTVLLVEDEPQLRRFLRAALPAHGFRLIEAATGREALLSVTMSPPDLILLDLGLPDTDGLEVARRIREWSDVPIIVLSAREHESQKVTALDAGADDYLTKPFGVAELLARMRVALRHAARTDKGGETLITCGPLTIDLAKRQVTVNGKDIRLTPIEYRLLTTLAKHAGKVVTHRQLLEAVWGPKSESQTQYLRVHMTHLRRKLEPDPVRPRLFVTEAGVGYRLRSDDSG